MATFKVSVQQIRDVQDHPNADRLSLVKVLGYTVITKRDEYAVGDTVIYIPTQAVLPQELISELGLDGRLAGKAKNRVKEIKLRGCFSEGLIYPNKDNLPIGTDVTELLGITKYEQPIPPALAGEVDNIGLDYALKFDIENFKNYPDIIKEGDQVVFTEKLHGTCFIAGAVPDNRLDENLIDGQFFVGSKGLISKGLSFKDNEANQKNTYLSTAKKLNVFNALKILANERNDTVYILGEVFGDGIQDLQYGANQNERFLRVFAVYVGQGAQKRSLPSDDVDAICERFYLDRVPVLYRGAFSLDKMKEYTDGLETVSGEQKHIREGIVITLAREGYHPEIGRVILKSISEDYLLRKNATEYN